MRSASVSTSDPVRHRAASRRDEQSDRPTRSDDSFISSGASAASANACISRSGFGGMHHGVSKRRADRRRGAGNVERTPVGSSHHACSSPRWIVYFMALAASGRGTRAAYHVAANRHDVPELVDGSAFAQLNVVAVGMKALLAATFGNVDDGCEHGHREHPRSVVPMPVSQEQPVAKYFSTSHEPAIRDPDAPVLPEVARLFDSREPSELDRYRSADLNLVRDHLTVEIDGSERAEGEVGIGMAVERSVGGVGCTRAETCRRGAST